MSLLFKAVKNIFYFFMITIFPFLCLYIFAFIKLDKYQGYQPVLIDTYGMEFQEIRVVSRKNTFFFFGVFGPREHEYTIEISEKDHMKLIELLESGGVPGWRAESCGFGLNDGYEWRRSNDLRRTYSVYVIATASVEKPIITIEYLNF